jgi:hypothetical protein
MCVQTCYTELVFLQLAGSMGPVVPPDASGAQNFDAQFFMLGWAWCSIHKKRTGTHYLELVFLLLVGSPGHVVQLGVFGPRKIDALFFMLRWAQYGFHKTLVRSCSAFWCIQAMKRRCIIFHARVGLTHFP